MRYLKAFLATVLTLLGQILFPIFYQWYKQFTGINPIGLAVFFFFLSCGAIALIIAFWVSAIKDKDLKDM